MARLEEMQTEARDFMATEGGQRADGVYRGCVLGLRSAPVLVNGVARTVRAMSRGPVCEGDAGSSSSRPKPYSDLFTAYTLNGRRPQRNIGHDHQLVIW